MVCKKNLTDEMTLQMLERADAPATSTLVDGNIAKEVIAAAQAGGRRKRKNEEEKEGRE